jgi:hypothetical protein
MLSFMLQKARENLVNFLNQAKIDGVQFITDGKKYLDPCSSLKDSFSLWEN